ncbi:MAG: ABC transporter ATP-binding protein [Candidatus Omnitrophica bacterium]|nr:ABC transporter ATP-binding protein [Candidatus Omnitrophota bacterium]
MIEAKNIHKIYDRKAKQLHVLQGIDFHVSAGEMVAIVGPSGAGKSTLLHILGGLDKPDDGNVIFDNQDIYRLNNKQRARACNQDIGFIFQFYHLLPEFTALENVILPALVFQNLDNPESVKESGRNLLNRVGLQERMEHKPFELSGGEQQRVAIARALINDPKIIFCDEPTGNLDSASGQAIIDLLMALNEKNKQTIIVVTHDENIAQRAHRIVYLKDGQVV